MTGMHSPHGRRRSGSRSGSRSGNRSGSRYKNRSRSNSAKKREQAAIANPIISIHRLDAEADAAEQAAELAANEEQSAVDKRKQFGAPEHKAATEIFHVIEPLKRERRWDVYSGEKQELLDEEHKRTDNDQKVQRHAKIAFHKDDRSTSRSR